MCEGGKQMWKQHSTQQNQARILKLITEDLHMRPGFLIRLKCFLLILELFLSCSLECIIIPFV